MKKNIIIVILIVIIAAESGYMLTRKIVTKTREELQEAKVAAVTPRPQPILLTKGMNLTTSPITKFIQKIAPGDLSDEAKKTLVGFSVTSKTQVDGSIVVTLTPKDSDDQNQQYTLQKNQILYFVEMTPADDKADSDKDLNYRDDYGIITDANGIIQ